MATKIIGDRMTQMTTMIPLFNDPNCKVFFGLVNETMVFAINTALGARIVTDRPFAKELEMILQQKLPWLSGLRCTVKLDMTKEWIPYHLKDGTIIIDPIVYSDLLDVT